MYAGADLVDLNANEVTRVDAIVALMKEAAEVEHDLPACVASDDQTDAVELSERGPVAAR